MWVFFGFDLVVIGGRTLDLFLLIIGYSLALGTYFLNEDEIYFLFLLNERVVSVWLFCRDTSSYFDLNYPRSNEITTSLGGFLDF